MKRAKKTRFLKAINAEKVRIMRDDCFSNAYIVDLPLDSTPDHVWQDFFEQEWKSSRLLWERKLYLVGCHLRLITPPDSIHEKLVWVKEILDKTNKRIEQYNQELESREVEMEDQAIRKRAELEKATIRGIRDAIKNRLRTF